MLNKVFAASFAVLALALAVCGQSKFEGFNVVLDVPTDQKQAACVIQYVSIGTVITVTDLDPSTPMKLTSCEGSDASVAQSSAMSATIRASATNYKWCFRGEDEHYKVTLAIPGRPPLTYNWYSPKDDRKRGFYNIRDYGAKGDGQTDDTNAFRSAMAQIASNNGGTLTVPDGEYIVTSSIAIPSGIIIQGTNGLNSFATTSGLSRKNPSRIVLKGTNTALFKIGECIENVTIRDIELAAQSNEGTSGVEAVGAYISSQGFIFERTVFLGFNRGINVHALPQTNLNWQIDYIKVVACRFFFNRDAGIYVDSRNTDWKVESSLFATPKAQPGQSAHGIHIERAGMFTIMDTFCGGFPHARGGAFINILDSGNIQIIGSQSESMTNSIVFNPNNIQGVGDYSFPIVMMNSVFDDPIVFNGRRTLVSTGGSYGPRVFRLNELVRVYSTGDRFCYDGYTIGCVNGTKENFGKATVVFMTGQPAEGKVPGHPTFFGTDVEFGGSVKAPSFAANALPTGKADGSLAYCSNCRRSSTPCQAGGSGAPAMMVGGVWSCL